MPDYNRGDVVKLQTKYVDVPGGREHYAVVLTELAHNKINDYGTFAIISSDPPKGGGLGCYEITQYAEAGLDHVSYVTPWISTSRWHRVIRKAGQLTPYQLRRAIEELRKVISI